MNQSQNTLRPIQFLWISLALSIYWIYLAFVSEMVIVHDSLGYEQLGLLLYRGPWADYFRLGPNREPLYPLIIALSFHTADFLGVSHQFILKIFHLLILLMTQMMMLAMCRKLKISSVWTLVMLIYFSLSPAVINSAMTLYSEIIMFPLILGIVFWSVASWQTLHHKKPSLNIYLAGFWLGLFFLLTIFVKGIFELILIFFALPFLILLQRSLTQKNKLMTKSILGFLLIFYATTLIPLTGYKFLNQYYNGRFTLTDRGAGALYGNTLRRVMPLNSEKFWTGLAFIPGERFCRSVATPAACDFWSYINSDTLTQQKSLELSANGMPNQTIDQTLVRLAIKAFFQSPLQYFVFLDFEIFKMFFWESTRMGFVVYPEWLSHLYSLDLLENILTFALAFLSLLAVAYAAKMIYMKHKNIFSLSSDADEKLITLFFILFLLLTYLLAHSLFYILPRYALPISSLFIILIGFWLGHALPNHKQK